MKQLILVAALGLAVASMPAAAATATGTFNVAITLTSKCEVASAPTAAFAYTSFQTTAATFASSFNIRCTNTLPITSITLDNASVTDVQTNLAYTLTMGAAPASGTGANQSISLSGSMAAGQAGTCNAASCTNATSSNRQRTVTITY
jgi:hypothetical protein